MKKYMPVLLVFVFVFSVIGIAGGNPVWASPRSVGVDSSGVNSPSFVVKTITENGITNIGGVCTIEVEFKVPGVKLVADAEVPVLQSKAVTFYPRKDPNFSDEALLFPGCHFVHYKLDETNQYKIVNPMNTQDGNAKVCFGASPSMMIQIYYYLDTPPSGARVWIPLPTTVEDKNRLVCAQALYTGVYMPSGRYPIIPVSGEGGTAGSTGTRTDGSVQTPSNKVTITTSGTYSVGGICTIEANYKISGLSDVVQVMYAEEKLTEDTLVVPSDAVQGMFYFPGCHVLHYRDQKIKDEMTSAEGDWRICFAAVPEKIMTIYYYQDDLETVVPPWKPLVTTTENGLACADLVDWTGVYTPAGQ